MSDNSQSAGRREYEAQPLGERAGLVWDKQAKKTGEAETRTAGPDGRNARKLTRTV